MRRSVYISEATFCNAAKLVISDCSCSADCVTPAQMTSPAEQAQPRVVPGALQPVRIDRERDTGRYEDPNVWMKHTILDGPWPSIVDRLIRWCRRGDSNPHTLAGTWPWSRGAATSRPSRFSRGCAQPFDALTQSACDLSRQRRILATETDAETSLDAMFSTQSQHKTAAVTWQRHRTRQ